MPLQLRGEPVMIKVTVIKKYKYPMHLLSGSTKKEFESCMTLG
jgi:hypothetical protein